MSCSSLETAAAWLLDDLATPESEAFEEHYFACARCFERTLRLERLIGLLERALPPALTNRRRDALLEGRQLPLIDVPAGGRGLLTLDALTPAGIWAMRFDARGVERVDLEARTPAGQRLFAMSDVPFDAESGCVYMPCSVHYRLVFDTLELTVRLSAVNRQGGGSRPLGEYRLDHSLAAV